MGFPRAGASNKGSWVKTSYFLALNVNISKTVGDTAIVTINHCCLSVCDSFNSTKHEVFSKPRNRWKKNSSAWLSQQQL